MKIHKRFIVIGILVCILFTAYFIERNKIENTITVDNQTSAATPPITFYLTNSNPSDSQIIKGQQLGKASSISPKENEVVVSDTKITEDSNLVFEYVDYNGNAVVDYVNDYIPFNSKKYDMNLTVFDVNKDGIFEYE